MTLLNILTVSALALTSALVFAQQPRRDGNWEIKMEMGMEGMPQGMPPITTTQCVTKEQAEDPSKMLPQGPGRGNNMGDCKVSDYKYVGNKATWSMACTGQMPMTGNAEIVYGNDSYAGTMKMITSRGGQSQTMTMKYDAKRLGDCAK